MIDDRGNDNINDHTVMYRCANSLFFEGAGNGNVILMSSPNNKCESQFINGISNGVFDYAEQNATHEALVVGHGKRDGIEFWIIRQAWG